MNSLWIERYRPDKLSDCILPSKIKKLFEEYVKQNDIPQLLLSGRPGTGKTTAAKALCNEMNCDMMYINASLENGIDVIRNKIEAFASTISLSGGKKVVIMDEADGLNPNSAQPAFRAFTEMYSNNCRFILTANYKKKILPALAESRFTDIEYAIPSAEKPRMAKEFMNRTKQILEAESVNYDPKVLARLVAKYFPDFRRTLNALQRYAKENGAIDVGILSSLESVSVVELVDSLKSKDFTGMRKWVNENMDQDPASIIRSIFDGLEEYMIPSSIPQAIVHLNEFQKSAAFVADQEINLSAMFIHIMADCVWKD